MWRRCASILALLCAVSKARDTSHHSISEGKAWVVLIMGDMHLEPTLVLVASLKMTQTRYSIVALVWKITEESRNMLTKLNVRVVDLHPVSCPQTVTRHDKHHLLMQFACSKIPNLLNLTTYNTVAYLDTDMLPLVNVDSLLDIPLPADKDIAMVSNPSSPNDMDWTSGLPVGPRYGWNGGVMVLRTSQSMAIQFEAFLDAQRTRQWFHNRAEQEHTAHFFEGRIHALPVTYNWAPWNMCYHSTGLEKYAIAHPPQMLHFSGHIKIWTGENQFVKKYGKSDCGKLGLKWICAWKHSFSVAHQVLRHCVYNCSRSSRDPSWIHSRDQSCNLTTPANIAPSNPIFIMGASHSGSSLLQQLVGVHPNIMALPESYVFRNNPSSTGPIKPPEFVDFYKQDPWNAEEVNAIIASASDLRQFLISFFGQFTKLHNKTRWSEKTPQHCWHAHRIHQLFPEARMILILRHPRDVVGSLMLKRGWTAERAVNRWISMYAAMRSFLYAPWMLNVYYDDLVRAPQAQMNAIFLFLGEARVPNIEVKLQNSDLAQALVSQTQGINKLGASKDKEIFRRISPDHAYDSRQYVSQEAERMLARGETLALVRDWGLEASSASMTKSESMERICHSLWRTMAPWTANRLGLMLHKQTIGGPKGWQRSEQRHGELSIGGPSLVYVPNVIPLAAGVKGRFFMYFAAHRSAYIRLATAHKVEGPWEVHNIRIAAVDSPQNHCVNGHVASPDVHITAESTFEMFFHSQVGESQLTFIAHSNNGLEWKIDCKRGPIGPFYFRAFSFAGTRYAVAKGDESGVLLRETSTGMWEEGPKIIPNMRHAAVATFGNELVVVYSQHSEVPPEHLSVATAILNESAWHFWRLKPGQHLLIPELEYEGSKLPLQRSTPGTANGVRQLRDPALFFPRNCVMPCSGHVMYSVQGEGGIALAELVARASTHNGCDRPLAMNAVHSNILAPQERNIDVVVFAAYLTCTLPYVVHGLRTLYGFRRIVFVVDQPEFCEGVQYLDNQSTCYHRDDVTYNTTFVDLWHFSDQSKHAWRSIKGHNQRLSSRVGWYLMQFNKWGIVNRDHALTERFMVWDGDIIPLVHQPWILGTKDALCTKAATENLVQDVTGEQESVLPQESFVCGMQVFRKSIVRELIEHIESHLGGTYPWNIFAKFQSPTGYFSEFQTYGRWVLSHQPDIVRKTPRAKILRNPRELAAGNCCPTEATIKKYREEPNPTVNLIWEEHKYRVDKKCKYGIDSLGKDLPSSIRLKTNWTLAIMSDFQVAAEYD